MKSIFTKLLLSALVFASVAFITGNAAAAPFVYIPLGSGNQVIKVDAANAIIQYTTSEVKA